MLDYEYRYILQGKERIAGVDEAGRGPLAGPVAIAAVIMPLDKRIEGIDDSKKLTALKREELYDKIVKAAICYKCILIDRNVIDDINILQATIKGMRDAVNGLSVQPDLVLLDAVAIKGLPYESEAIIKGDTLSYNIAAASIIAKVQRDRLMIKYSEEYPEYGFDRHKGYGTKEHLEALKRYGATPIHRKSFIKNIV